MFRTLLESNAPRQRRRASTLASIAAHTAIIGGAIAATASARPEPPRDAGPREKPPLYIPIGETKSAARRREPLTELPRFDLLPRPDRWVIEFAPDRAPIATTDIDPTLLLAPDTVGVGGKQGGGGLPFSHAGDHGFGNQPATAATVDRAAALLTPPRPQYPDPLRRAGVTGRVVVRLVVDTTGRVEPTSVVIREASHDLFAQAVRAVLPSLRFVPADAGGRKVRMLVDLPFEFRLHE
jgi:protein TonB